MTLWKSGIYTACIKLDKGLVQRYNAKMLWKIKKFKIYEKDLLAGQHKKVKTQFRSLIVTQIDCQLIFPQFNRLYDTANENRQIQFGPVSVNSLQCTPYPT